MGKFKDRAAVRSFVDSDIKTFAANGLAGFARAKQKMVPTMKALTEAIRVKDADAIRVQMRLLDPEMKDAQNAMTWLAQASNGLTTLAAEKDDEIAEAIAALEPLVQKTSEADRVLPNMMDAADRMIIAAEKLLSELDKGEVAASKFWSRIVAVQREHSREMEGYLHQAKETGKIAWAAVRARDAAALAKARQAIKGTAGSALLVTVDRMAKDVESFFKRYDRRDFTPQFSAQLDREVKELRDLATIARPKVQEILEVQRDIESMNIEAPDIAKALKVLGLKASQSGDLKKALDGNEGAIVKSLDSLAKTAGLKSSGKDMLAKLKREGILS